MVGKLIDFNAAKEPHVLKRKDRKIADIKKAFKASRAEAGAIDLVQTKRAKKRRKKNNSAKKK